MGNSDNIITKFGGYYLGFNVINSDFKMKELVVDLSGEGASGEYTSMLSVNYYYKNADVSTATPFYTESVESGKTADGLAYAWGKNITGYYTDSTCTVEWTNKTITAATTVFCTSTDWTEDNYSKNGYVLSNSLIYTASKVINASDDSKPLNGTIYTVLKGCTFVVSSFDVTECTVLNTGGGFSSSGPSKGLQFTVENAGIIRLYASGAGSTGRTVRLYSEDGKTKLQESTEIGKTDYSYVEFKIETPGTYNFGSSGAINIYSVSFTESTVETPVLEQQENGTGTAIRFIATVEGITSETQVASWKVIISTAGKTDYVSSSFTDLYTAVTANNADKNNGKDAADNTLYLVATLKNIPSSYNDVTISTKVVVTLNDDNHTVLTSNVVT